MSDQQTRFDELAAKGYNKLNGDERKEYKELKAQLADAPSEPAAEAVATESPTDVVVEQGTPTDIEVPLPTAEEINEDVPERIEEAVVVEAVAGTPDCVMCKRPFGRVLRNGIEVVGCPTNSPICHKANNM